MTKKEETTFNPPYVAAGVSPAAARYAQNLQARKGGEPVGGGPTPPIPLLNQDLPEGPPRTMAQHATAMRSIVERAAPKETPDQKNLQLLNTDVLPGTARADPSYQSGMGADVAVNQPHLAAKYGVMRGGNFVPPQQLYSAPAVPVKGTGSAPAGLQGEMGKRISTNTAKGLEQLAKAQAQQHTADDVVEDTAEQAARSGIAGGVENAGSGATATPSNDEIARRLQQMDEFDIDQLQEAMVRDLLNNAEQRKIIEERLEPLSLTDLIVNSRVRQRVVIVPNDFEIVFESLTAQDELSCKRLIVEESRKLQLTEEYFLQKFSYMGLACSLYSVNRMVLPSHRDDRGVFNEDNFWKKFQMVMGFPLPMLASLGVNYFWFDVRVRRLFVAQRVKNG